LRTVGSPFFAPFEDALEARGSELVESLPELELGFTECLGNGRGGKEPSDTLSFLLVEGRESFEEFGGELFLFGGQRDVVHDEPRGEFRAD
jgi:hypothetical protein